jgi:hypothetical protein
LKLEKLRVTAYMLKMLTDYRNSKSCKLATMRNIIIFSNGFDFNTSVLKINPQHIFLSVRPGSTIYDCGGKHMYFVPIDKRFLCALLTQSFGSEKTI